MLAKLTWLDLVGHNFVCVAVQSRSANVVLHTRYGASYFAHCNQCGLMRAYGNALDEPDNPASLFEGYKPGTLIQMERFF